MNPSQLAQTISAEPAMSNKTTLVVEMLVFPQEVEKRDIMTVIKDLEDDAFQSYSELSLR